MSGQGRLPLEREPEMMAWPCWLPREARWFADKHRAVGYAVWCGPMGTTTDADEVASWGPTFAPLAEWLRGAA